MAITTKNVTLTETMMREWVCDKFGIKDEIPEEGQHKNLSEFHIGYNLKEFPGLLNKSLLIDYLLQQPKYKDVFASNTWSDDNCVLHDDIDIQTKVSLIVNIISDALNAGI